MTERISFFEGPVRSGISTMAPLSGMTLTFTWSPTFKRARSLSAVSKMIPCELPTFEIVVVLT